MSKRRKRKLGSWQLLKLSTFVRKEREESRLYELYFRTIEYRIPIRIVTVMLFFEKETYVRRPGSLVALYRISEGTERPILDFLERYDAYYSVLEKEGYL